MNQISRISLCKSLLRRNPLTRSSKPISSSSSLICSKFHHTFINLLPPPPQIFSTPGNQFRNYSFRLLKLPKDSGECNLDDDMLKEIAEIDSKIDEARGWIAVGNEHKECYLLWPCLEEAAVRARGAVKIASDEFDALVAKLGHHDTEKKADEAHQRQLRRLRQRVRSLNESLDKFVDFSEIYELEDRRTSPVLKSDAHTIFF